MILFKSSIFGPFYSFKTVLIIIIRLKVCYKRQYSLCLNIFEDWSFEQFYAYFC